MTDPRPPVYPTLTPHQSDPENPDHFGFFSEVGEELLSQLSRHVEYVPLLPELPAEVRNDWLRTPGLVAYWKIILFFDGRTFTLYQPISEEANAHPETHELTENTLLQLLQGLFDDFRIRTDYPDRWMDKPDMASPGYLAYNDVLNPEPPKPGEEPGQRLGRKVTEPEVKAYFARIDYEMARFKALVGEEVYQRLLKTEDDL